MALKTFKPKTGDQSLTVSIVAKGFSFNSATSQALELLSRRKYVQLSYDEGRKRIYFSFTEEPLGQSMLLRSRGQYGAYLDRVRYFNYFGINHQKALGKHNLKSDGDDFYIELESA